MIRYYKAYKLPPETVGEILTDGTDLKTWFVDSLTLLDTHAKGSCVALKRYAGAKMLLHYCDILRDMVQERLREGNLKQTRLDKCNNKLRQLGSAQKSLSRELGQRSEAVRGECRDELSKGQERSSRYIEELAVVRRQFNIKDHSEAWLDRLIGTGQKERASSSSGSTSSDGKRKLRSRRHTRREDGFNNGGHDAASPGPSYADSSHHSPPTMRRKTQEKPHQTTQNRVVANGRTPASQGKPLTVCALVKGWATHPSLVEVRQRGSSHTVEARKASDTARRFNKKSHSYHPVPEDRSGGFKFFLSVLGK